MPDSVSNAMVSGALGGICMVYLLSRPQILTRNILTYKQVITSHPFDLIKTRLQTNNFPIYIKTFNQAAHFAINENTSLKSFMKVKQLYKGVLPVLLGSAPLCNLYSFIYQTPNESFKTQ